MAGGNWEKVEKKHVIEAIQKFNEEGIKAYSVNTFLIFNNDRYPAKHIRAMAYEAAFGEFADKSTFSGGKETALFFERLGFEVDYNRNRCNTFADKVNKSKGKNKKTKAFLELLNKRMLYKFI